MLIAALLALADGGPGDLPLDARLGLDDAGPAWALGALAVGAAASTLTIELRQRAPGGAPAGADSDAGWPYPGSAGDRTTES